MKIKFLDTAMLGNKVYIKGDEAEIPDITASELIKKKLAIDPEQAAADQAKAKAQADAEKKAKAAADKEAKAKADAEAKAQAEERLKTEETAKAEAEQKAKAPETKTK